MTNLTHQSIARLVPTGSRVLDLGCGDGALLALLQKERGCTGYGIELDDANVQACVKRGVNVIQLNLDEGLAVFDDASFDVVLQIDTLQHLRNAETMLRTRWVSARRWFVATLACAMRISSSVQTGLRIFLRRTVSAPETRSTEGLRRRVASATALAFWATAFSPSASCRSSASTSARMASRAWSASSRVRSFACSSSSFNRSGCIGRPRG